MAVAREELFDAERSGAMGRADQHDVAESVRDQLDPAEDERAHDYSLEPLSVCTSVATVRDRPRSLRPTRSRAIGRAGATRQHITSPVNIPGRRTVRSVSVLLDGRTASTRPAVMTKKGTTRAPASISTSPGWIERTPPWAAIRLTCAGVKIGNMRSAPEESVSGKSAKLYQSWVMHLVSFISCLFN